MLTYYIIDTETTGLNPAKHEISEISIIRCSNRTQLTRQVKCDHPEFASDIALEITGKTIPDLLKGDSKLDVVRRCNDFLAEDGGTPESRCMVAHRATFDKNFCHALWEEAGIEFPAHHWMDTWKFAKDWSRHVGREPENFKLKTVLAFAGIKAMPGEHNASSDARNTYLFWKKGMDMGINHLPAIKPYRHKIG